MGFEKFLAPGRGEARLEARPRAAGSHRAAAIVGPRGAYRRARAEAEGAATGSAWCCRSASSPPRRCAALPPSRGDGRRRYPAHGLAEPADLRRAGGEGCGRRAGDRGARPRDQGHGDPRRPGRLHRQHRLPLRRLRHQASRRGDRALVRGARRARRADQHSSHRLPSLLRAALHRRHRPARLQGADLGGGRHGRGLSHPGRRRLRPGRHAGARIVPRRQGRGCAESDRADAENLSGATSVATRAFQAFTRRHDDRGAAGDVRGVPRDELAAAPAAGDHRAGERAVHGGAARLAQRLFRRPAGRRRGRAVAAGCLGAFARISNRLADGTTGRPGTTRPCRLPSG